MFDVKFPAPIERRALANEETVGKSAFPETDGKNGKNFFSTGQIYKTCSLFHSERFHIQEILHTTLHNLSKLRVLKITVLRHRHLTTDKQTRF